MCCLFDKLSRVAANKRKPLPFPEHHSRHQYIGKQPWWYYEDGTPMPDDVVAEHLQAAEREADERKRAPPLSKSAPKAKPLLRPKIPPRGTYQVGGSSSSTNGGAATPAATTVIVIDPPRAQANHPSCPPPDWDESYRRVPKVPAMVPPTEELPSVPKPPPIPLGKFGDGIPHSRPLAPWRRAMFGSQTVAPPPTWNPPPPALNHQQQIAMHKQHAMNMMSWGAHIAKLITLHGSHLPQPKPPTEVHTPELPTAPINTFIPPLQPPPPPPSRPHAATPTPPLDPVLQAKNLWEETPIPPAPPLHPEQESEAPPPHPVSEPDHSPTPEYSPNGSHYSEGWEQVERALQSPFQCPWLPVHVTANETTVQAEAALAAALAGLQKALPTTEVI